MRRLLLIPAFSLVLLPFVSLSQERYERWRPVTQADWNVQENDALGIRHAILIYDGSIIDDRDQEDGKQYSSWYQRIRVFDEDGIEANRTVEIPFLEGLKIKELKARTLKSNGEEVLVDKSEVYEKTTFSFGSVRLKAKAFAFKGVEPGDILEYYASVESDSDDPPKVQIRHRAYTLESEITWYYQPVETLSYYEEGTIRDSKRIPAWTITNNEQLYNEIEELPEGNPDHFYIRHLNIPELPDEEYMPSIEEIGTVFIGSYRFPEWEQRKPYWARAAAWYGERTEKFLEKDSALDEWVGERSDRERDLNRDMEDCYAWIREHLRIFEWMSEGERPEKFKHHHHINELMKKRIGSIQEVNMLCLGMLRRLGYEATIFHNRDQSLGPFLIDWHTARQFTMSGIVVRDSDELRWFFPAYPSSTPDALIWRAAGCNALLEDSADEALPILARIPLIEAERNRIAVKAWLSMDDLIRLKGRLEVTWDCPSDIDLRLGINNETEKDACDFLRKRALQSGVKWDEFDESFSDDGRTVAYRCSIEVDGLIEDAGPRKTIELGQIRNDFYSISTGKRECPILFNFPVSYYGRVELELPEGFILSSVPRYAESENAAISYACQWTTEAGKVVRQRRLNVIHSGYFASAAEILGRTFESVYATDMDPLVIKDERGDE